MKEQELCPVYETLWELCKNRGNIIKELISNLFASSGIKI